MSAAHRLDGDAKGAPARHRAGGWGRAAGAAVVALGALAVTARAAPPAVAVPFYDAGHFVQGLHRALTAPAAQRFAARAGALSTALRGHCDARGAGSLADARAGYGAAVDAWERLSAVAVGPLLERRSLRAIDFAPPRPALIERAIDAQPRGAEAMERVGTPAKGLPALEWLLWTRPVERDTPACRYAVEVAADIGREADALAGAFDALARRDWSGDEAAGPAMAEALNQWLGGLERLRWAGIERPLRAAAGAGDVPAFPRRASGGTAAAWAAEWDTLRALGRLAAGAAPPQPGQGLVPFETYLRGRGLNPQADALRRAIAQADTALDGLMPESGPRLQAAARALDALAREVEGQVAPALEVSIGFSDADGD